VTVLVKAAPHATGDFFSDLIERQNVLSCLSYHPLSPSEASPQIECAWFISPDGQPLQWIHGHYIDYVKLLKKKKIRVSAFLR
jgi:hypothetical protein